MFCRYSLSVKKVSWHGLHPKFQTQRPHFSRRCDHPFDHERTPTATMRMKLTTTMALWAMLSVPTVDASNIHAPHDPRKVLPVSTRAPLQPSQHHPKQLRRVMGADWDRMPSLFMDDEEIYDRYAACLAATEGLRRIRDRDLAEVAQQAYEGGDDTATKSPALERKQIVQNYIQNSSRVLRAMGMPVKQFNELGREIAQSEKLKGRVSFSL